MSASSQTPPPPVTVDTGAASANPTKKPCLSHEQFNRLCDAGKRLHRIAKQHGMTQYRQISLKKTIYPEYYKAVEKEVEDITADFDEGAVTSTLKKLVYQKTKMSEAMGAILGLSRHSKYFEARYQDTLDKLEKDRCKAEHHTMILKMYQDQKKMHANKKAKQ